MLHPLYSDATISAVILTYKLLDSIPF